MDRPTEQLLQRILTCVAETGDEQAARLVAEARAEAEAEVKDLLKSAMKASLLRSAADRLEAQSVGPREDPLWEQSGPAPTTSPQ